MDDDIAKLLRDLEGGVGAYGELYPSFARRLREAASSSNPEVRKRLHALLVGKERRVRRWCEQLQATWALTATEVRLTLHLADGGTIKGYADLFGVAESTVRTQLKSVFAKTGVNRQAALARLVGRP
jgi:DNA-binding CsgD family transcriptional regulator